MARIVEIEDLSAPELGVYARLTEAQLRSRLEPEKGVFIAESPKVIRLALEAGCVPVSLLMERRHLTGQGAALMERCGDVPVYTADREVLASLTGYALTRGILCAMRRPAPRRAEELCRSARRIAVLENIVDTMNLGAIFRSAAALGVDAVLLSPSCCDPLNRRAGRAGEHGECLPAALGQIGRQTGGLAAQSCRQSEGNGLHYGGHGPQREYRPSGRTAFEGSG